VEQAQRRTTSDVNYPGTKFRDCIKTQVMLAARSGCRLLFAALAKTSLARGRRQSARKCFRTDRDVEQAQRRTTSDVNYPGTKFRGFFITSGVTPGRSLSIFSVNGRQLRLLQG